VVRPREREAAGDDRHLSRRASLLTRDADLAADSRRRSAVRAPAAVVRRLKPRLRNTKSAPRRGGSLLSNAVRRIGDLRPADGRMFIGDRDRQDALFVIGARRVPLGKSAGVHRPMRGIERSAGSHRQERWAPRSGSAGFHRPEPRSAVERSVGFHRPEAVAGDRRQAVGRCRTKNGAGACGADVWVKKAVRCGDGADARGWATGVCLFRLDAGLTFHDCAAPVTVAGLAADRGRRGCRKRARGGADVRDRGVLRPV
jgi:hypothetical protein